MSMEMNKALAEQAGGDERAAFNAWLNEVTYEENTDRGVFKVQRHQTLSLEDERIAWRAWQGRALLARSEQEEMERLREAYERGYGDGQNNPNGYSDKKERDACVNELLKQPSPAQAEDAPVIGCLCGMPMTEGHHSPDGCSSLEEFAPHLSAQAHPEQTEGAQGEREQFERWLAAYLGRKFEAPYDLARFEDSGEYRYNPAADYWKVWQEARAALAQPSPAPKLERPEVYDSGLISMLHTDKNVRQFVSLEQYERIVGALRALAEREYYQGNLYLDRARMAECELEAAQARVAELELKLDKSDYAYDNDRIHMRGLAARAIARAKVFDDGSDGADAESARSVVAILRELLAVGPAQAQHSVPGDIMRDAQRYRWLRDQQFYFSFSTENSDAGISSCTAGMSSRFKNLSWVDAAIDSAIAAAPGKEVGHE